MQTLIKIKKENRFEKRNTKLEQKHLIHKSPYFVDFGEYKLSIDHRVFNPSYGEGARMFLENRELLKADKVLDMGAGSGALGILASQYASSITGIDISSHAYNCTLLNYSTHINRGKEHLVFKGDLFSPLHETDSYDLIIFNPPFLEGKPENPIQQAMYDEGYNTLRDFFSNAHKHLNDNGRILLCFGEVGDCDLLIELATINGFKTDIVIQKKFSNIKFFVYEFIR